MCVMALVTRKTTTASTNASPSHHTIIVNDADTTIAPTADTTLSSSCHSSPYRSATRGVLLRLQHARREAQGQQHADNSNKTSSSNTTTKCTLTNTTTTDGCMTLSSPVLVEPTRQPAPRPRSIRRTTTTTTRQSELRSESRTHEAEQQQPQCSALSAPSSLASTLNSTSAVHTMPTTANDGDISSSKGTRNGACDKSVTAAAVTTHATPIASTTITSSSSSSSKNVAATVGSARHDEEVGQSQGSRCSRDRPSPMVVRQDNRTHSHLPRYTHKSDEDEKQKDKGGKQAVVEMAAEEDAAVQRDNIMTSCKATTTTDVLDEANVVVMHAQSHSVRDADTTDSATRHSATCCSLQTANQASHNAVATRLSSSYSPHHHHGCAEDHEGDSACHITSSHHTPPVITTTASSDATVAIDVSHTHAMSPQRDKSTEQGTPHSVSRMTGEVNALLRTRTAAPVTTLVGEEKNMTCNSSSSCCVAAPVMPDDGDRDTVRRHTTLHSSSSSKKEGQGSAMHDTANDGCGAVSELRMAHTPDTVALPCHSPYLARPPSSQQQQQPTSNHTHIATTTTDNVAVSQPPSAHHSSHCLSSLDRWRAAQQTQKTITTTTTNSDERKEEDNVLLVLPSSATPHTPLPCPLTAASSSPSTSHASSSTTTTTTPATKTTLADSVRQPCHSAMPHAVCESTACDFLHSSLASPCLQRTPAPTHINTTTTTTITGDGVVNENVVHSSLERWRRTQAAAGATVTTTATASNSGRSSSVAIESSRASQRASARQHSNMPTSPHPPTNSSSSDGRVKQHDSAEAAVLDSSAKECHSEGLALVSQDNNYACNTAQDVKAVHAECITTIKEEEQPTQGETRDDMKEHGSEGEEREKETHDVSAPHTPSAVSPHVNTTSLPASVLVHDTSHTNSCEITSQAEAASSLLVPHAVHANERTPHKAAIEQSHGRISKYNNKEGVVKQVGKVQPEMTALAQQSTHLTHMDTHNDTMHNTIAKVEAGVGHALQQAKHVTHERESPRLPSHTTTTTASITDTHSPSPVHSTTDTTTTHSDTPCDGRCNTVKNNSNNNAAVVVKGDGSSSVSVQSPSLPSTSVLSVAGASTAAMPKSQYVHDLQAFITRLEQQLSRASFAEAADTAAAPQHTSPKYEKSKSSNNTRGHEKEHVVCRKSTLHGSSSSSADAIAAGGQHLTVSDMKAVKDAACVGMHGSVAVHVPSLPRHHPATSTSLLAQPERTSGTTKSSTACTAVIEPRNTVSTTITTTTTAMPETKTHILQQQLHAPRAAVRTMTTGIAAIPALATAAADTVADGEATRARSHTDTHAEGTTHPTTTTAASYSATAAADMDSVTSETDEDVPFWCDRLLLYDDEEDECRGQSHPAHTTASPCSSDNDSVPEAIRRVPRLDLSALYIPDDAFLAERYRIPMPTCETRPDEARLRLWHEVGIASASRNNNSAGAAAVVSEDNTSVVCAVPHYHHYNNNNKRAAAVEGVKNEVACVEEKKDGEVHTAVHATTTSVVETGSIMERLRQHRAQREQRRLVTGATEDNTMKSEDVIDVKKEEDIAGGQTMTSSIVAENGRACAEPDTPPPAPPASLRASQQGRDEEDTRKGGNAAGTRTTAAVVATSAVQLKDKTPPRDTTTTTNVDSAEKTSATLHQADRDHSTRHTALLSRHTVHDTTDSPLPHIATTTTTTTTLSLRMRAEGDKGQQNESDSHSVAVRASKDDNNDDGVATAPHRMSSSHTNDTAHTDSNNNSGRGTMCQQQHICVDSKDGFESELSGHYGHHFSDASDALDGGRGVEQERRTRMRSLRVQLLLLTCQEQRGRKSIWAEEAMMIERMCRHAYDNSSRSDGCCSMSAAPLRVTLSP